MNLQCVYVYAGERDVFYCVFWVFMGLHKVSPLLPIGVLAYSRNPCAISIQSQAKPFAGSPNPSLHKVSKVTRGQETEKPCPVF